MKYIVSIGDIYSKFKLLLNQGRTSIFYALDFFIGAARLHLFIKLGHNNKQRYHLFIKLGQNNKQRYHLFIILGHINNTIPQLIVFLRFFLYDNHFRDFWNQILFNPSIIIYHSINIHIIFILKQINKYPCLCAFAFV